MTEKRTRTTIGQLRQAGAVGQVFSVSGLRQYIIVEETAGGVNVICLNTVIGNSDEAFKVPDMQEIFVEDREHWKESFAKRWDEIAQRYPAIG